MLSEHTQRWLEGRLDASAELQRMLGISGIGYRCQRVAVLDALAESMGLEIDRFGEAAYGVLDALIDPLQEVLASGPVQWYSDPEMERHRLVVQAALEGLPLEEVLAAATEFGWGRQSVSRVPGLQFDEVASVVEQAFTKKLGQAVFSALTDWELGRPRRERRPGSRSNRRTRRTA